MLQKHLGFKEVFFFSATTVVETAKEKQSPEAFGIALDNLLGEFAFPAEFVLEVWGAIKQTGILKNKP